jgi:hypothetical protein
MEEEDDLMLKNMWAVAITGLLTVLAYSGPARAASPLTGSFLVQASGTAYFFTCQTPPTPTNESCADVIPGSPNYSSGQGTTEVLHFTMAGSATFANGLNTSVNLTLNLGGEDDNSTNAASDSNELICYLTQPGDLIYTAATGSTPAMLTVTYNYNNGNGDTCNGPNNLPSGGVYEQGDVIPFNFYPSSNLPSSGGVIISNYSLSTTGGGANGWKDGGYPDSHVIVGMSATGQVTPTTTSPPLP